MMCDDLGTTIGRIGACRGEFVIPPTESGDAGWLAHALVTEGNLIGLWQVRLD